MNWQNSVFLFGLLLMGCSKVDDLLTFRITNESSFRVDSALPLNIPLEIPTPDITTNSNQNFENNNTRADLVKDITLDQLDLTVTNPAGKNFDFLKSVSIFISTSSSPEIELASEDDVPLGVTTVVLQPTNAKLDAYVKASSFKLRTQIVTRETLTQAVDVKVKIEFKVTAKPL